MRRFHLRYISVAVALCVMLVGATVAGASWSERPGASDNSASQAAAKANGKVPAHANGRGPSVRDAKRGPSPVVATTPAILRAPLHAAVQRVAANRVNPDQRYQWSGVVRTVNEKLVLYRGCDRWLLDAESQEVQEALRGAVDGDRVDVWGRLSRGARHTIEAHAVYGPNDPRPRILIPDYPCPRDEKPNHDFARAGGTITEIDLDNRVIVLRTGEGPMRFHVTEGASIMLNGEPVRLSALAAGMRVRVGYNSVTQEANRIVAVSDVPAPATETAGGHITEIDLSNRVLVLQTDEGPMRFRLTRATGVSIDLVRATLLDLEPDMPARITYSTDGQVALRIMAISNP